MAPASSSTTTSKRPKSDSRKRQGLIGVRVDEHELEQLRSSATQQGITIPELLRRGTLGRPAGA